MDRLTLILQEAPYGSEKAYNALRYASGLVAQRVAVHLFLLGDGVLVAKARQKTPTGYYNAAEMLSALIAQGVEVKA